MNYLLRLNSLDNVLVALRAVPAGTKTAGVVLNSHISMAHKVAAQAITSGEDIIKCGMVIGRATCSIAMGDHVHVHNIESKYTATHFRKEETK